MPAIEPLLAASLAATPAVYLAALRWRLGGPRRAAETSFIETPDGARLALHRYAASGARPDREPVLLVSGFGLNAWALDFDERYSWARRVAAAGFDAWILEVRGSGCSKRAGRHDGSFDDYLVDARAAVAHILAATGAEKVHWVGYSLGGMLLYALLGTELAARIRSAVCVEAPTSLEGYPLDDTSRAVLDTLARRPWLSALPYRLASRLLMPVLPRLYGASVFTTWMNLENIDRAILPSMVYRTLDDVPVPLVLQFRDWTTCDTLRSVDGRTDHLEGLAGTRVPILVITGSSDFGRRARGALERLQGTPVRSVELVRAKGSRVDYGHADLLFGREAPTEVVPHVLDWVLGHDPAMRAIA